MCCNNSVAMSIARKAPRAERYHGFNEIFRPWERIYNKASANGSS